MSDQTGQAPLLKTRFVIDTRIRGVLACNLVHITAIDSTISLIHKLMWSHPEVESVEVERIEEIYNGKQAPESTEKEQNDAQARGVSEQETGSTGNQT